MNIYIVYEMNYADFETGLDDNISFCFSMGISTPKVLLPTFTVFFSVSKTISIIFQLFIYFFNSLGRAISIGTNFVIILFAIFLVQNEIPSVLFVFQ